MAAKPKCLMAFCHWKPGVESDNGTARFVPCRSQAQIFELRAEAPEANDCRAASVADKDLYRAQPGRECKRQNFIDLKMTKRIILY